MANNDPAFLRMKIAEEYRKPRPDYIAIEYMEATKDVINERYYRGVGRGGARPGSGRHSLDKSEKRVSISLSVAPETVEGLDFLRERGYKPGRMFDEYVDKLVADMLEI